MHRERQARDPRFAVKLVLQIELGGGCVLHDGLRAEVVDGLDEQMRLLPAHEVDVAHRPAGIARQR